MLSSRIGLAIEGGNCIAQRQSGKDTPEMYNGHHSEQTVTTTTQDIIGLLVDREATFSKSNRRIAQAILSNPRAFVQRPVDELSEWLGVSAPRP